ncbi:MAG: RpiB/LacA/LacB family sugar-phosphate isomerase [Endomicrobia bacterium]|nr:RpiB/LacA/LacB family sugar-phosphate isomerase [Endomicrobiia bacterium]MCX7940483.1 RpiB/LacA/LacB family sugar-phosphate isomerase [Endomicrobiia bacterium]MDW8055110.1 RpiB/LacA/LacB family sugar-phosphate isomerase [Elusimicrobiota bacterium]
MKIAVGCDHGGFRLKEVIKKYLQQNMYQILDFGCYSEEPVDWPDIALLVAEAVKDRFADVGILIDSFGGAVCLAANKVKGIRAVSCYNITSAKLAREHDDANILCLGAKTVGEAENMEILKTFLSTNVLTEQRYINRLKKLQDIENKYFK